MLFAEEILQMKYCCAKEILLRLAARGWQLGIACSAWLRSPCISIASISKALSKKMAMILLQLGLPDCLHFKPETWQVKDFWTKESYKGWMVSI